MTIVRPPPPDPGDPDALFLQWAMGEDETRAPEIEIYVPARSGLTVSVMYRLGIDGTTVTWNSDSWTPEPLDVLVAPVSVPAEAFWDPAQEARLSSLTVEVSVWSEDVLLFVSGLAPLRVAFPNGTDIPIFLDATRMEVLAPGGVLLSSPMAGAGAWETFEPTARVQVDTNRVIARVDEQEEN